MDSRATTAWPCDKASLTSGDIFTKFCINNNNNNEFFIRKTIKLNREWLLLTLASESMGFKWFWILDNLERADDEEEEEDAAIFVESEREEWRKIIHLNSDSGNHIYFVFRISYLFTSFLKRYEISRELSYFHINPQMRFQIQSKL